MASRTRLRPETTRETVAIDTPAWSATSVIVGGLSPCRLPAPADSDVMNLTISQVGNLLDGQVGGLEQFVRQLRRHGIENIILA